MLKLKFHYFDHLMQRVWHWGRLRAGEGGNERMRWFSSVQFSSVAQSCLTLRDSMDCSTPGFSVHHQLPELAPTHVYWASDAIQPSLSSVIPSPPEIFPLLHPSIFPSIRIFSNESVLCIRWPKYWSFRISISSSNEYSGLISFRMDWLDLLAIQGTLKSLFLHHSSKVSILWCSAFFMAQLLHPLHYIEYCLLNLNFQLFITNI